MESSSEGNTWVMVLAAGDGTGLRGLTVTESGVHVQKQYGSLDGTRSLLGEAIQRALSITAAEFVCLLVARHHSTWWKSETGMLSPRNVFAQPADRGTAIGILLSLLNIAARDPAATVVTLPAGTFIGNEAALRGSVDHAIQLVRSGLHRTILLGTDPSSADSDLGLLVPGGSYSGQGVSLFRFHEKPARDATARMRSLGALWNTSILVSDAAALLNLIRIQHADAISMLQFAIAFDATAGSGTAMLDTTYARLPHVDFFSDVLLGQEARVGVLRVPGCDWSDLATPERVVDVLRRTACRPCDSPRPAPTALHRLSLLQCCSDYLANGNLRERVNQAGAASLVWAPRGKCPASEASAK